MRRVYFSLVASALPVLVCVATCSVDEIQLVGMACPCPVELVCDTASNTCVESLKATPAAGGAPASASSNGTTGGAGSGEGGQPPDGGDDASDGDASEEDAPPPVCIEAAQPCVKGRSVCCNGLICSGIAEPASIVCCGRYMAPCTDPEGKDCCGTMDCIGFHCQ